MSSPGQKRGGCGHLMVGFDTYSYCARCRDKGKGPEPCVENPSTTDCIYIYIFYFCDKCYVYNIQKKKKKDSDIANTQPVKTY